MASFSEITDTPSMSLDPLVRKVVPVYAQARSVVDGFIAPVFDLVLRIYIGLVFFRSGMLKAQDWESTVYLFQDEYKLPLLPPELAAVLGMSVEIGMPLFLFAGFAARLAALPLIVLTCVIQFVLGSMNPDYNSPEHFYWLFLLGVIVVRGPGKLSADHLIAKKLNA